MTNPDKPEKSPAHSLIDEHLKRVYQEVEDEALPDRFQDLLAKLREQDAETDDPEE